MGESNTFFKAYLSIICKYKLNLYIFVLTLWWQIEIEMKMSEEQANNTATQAVLDNLPGGEGELAGDPQALREPEGAPVQDGIISSAADIG